MAQQWVGLWLGERGNCQQ